MWSLRTGLVAAVVAVVAAAVFLPAGTSFTSSLPRILVPRLRRTATAEPAWPTSTLPLTALPRWRAGNASAPMAGAAVCASGFGASGAGGSWMFGSPWSALISQRAWRSAGHLAR